MPDSERSERGRKARNRGNAYERDVARRLGLSRVGQYGGKEDLLGGWMIAQCKVGSSYPERIDRWLRAMPTRPGALRIVVLGDAPGPGVRRRELVVIDLNEFIDWFVPDNR